MNSAGRAYKTSNVMHTTNKQIIRVFLFQLFFALIGSGLGSSWLTANFDTANYLAFDPEDKPEWFSLFVQKTGTWILIFTNFVPISLIVTLEIVKYWQGTFMSWDAQMADDQ